MGLIRILVVPFLSDIIFSGLVLLIINFIFSKYIRNFMNKNFILFYSFTFINNKISFNKFTNFNLFGDEAIGCGLRN